MGTKPSHHDKVDQHERELAQADVCSLLLVYAMQVPAMPSLSSQNPTQDTAAVQTCQIRDSHKQATSTSLQTFSASLSVHFQSQNGCGMQVCCTETYGSETLSSTCKTQPRFLQAKHNRLHLFSSLWVLHQKQLRQASGNGHLREARKGNAC